MTMTDSTFHAAVIGSPVDHSKSPDIHRAAYQILHVPIAYDRIDVPADRADEFMSSLADRYGSTTRLAGFSVTMPLKAALVPHMQEVSLRVQHLNVLNTVVFDDSGIATGYNTDVDGIRHALTNAGFRQPQHGSMAIIGAGGTASAAVGAAAEMGLDEVVFYVRNPARALDSAAVAQRFGLNAEIKLLDEVGNDVQYHSAVVTTLPANAADQLVELLPDGDLPPLLDVIYQPWPTQLAAAWRHTGARVASGLEMLLYQGVAQVQLFTEKLLDHQPINWDDVTTHMAAALGLQDL